MKILNKLGDYGPILLFFYSLFLLWEYKNMFFYYNIGIFFSIILNLIFKGIIQEPRPMFDNKKINLVKMYGKNYLYQNGIPFDIFGMPSGHAQTAFFSTIFVYLTLKNINILIFYILFSILICYQRVKYEYHSIQQVIVGSIVGVFFGHLMFDFSKNKIKGNLREKPDDNGPT